MKTEDFQNKMTEIQTKIGQDASSNILDDIGILLTDNQNMNKQITDKDNEIARQKKQIETLQNVNANLLQQIPMGDDEGFEKNQKKEEKPIEIDFRKAFDEKRKF